MACTVTPNINQTAIVIDMATQQTKAVVPKSVSSYVCASCIKPDGSSKAYNSMSH